MSLLVIDDTAGELPLSGMAYVPEAAQETGLVFVFAHGAGAGQSSPFMRRYAEQFAARGVAVVTFDFPYLAAGRKLPDRPPALEGAFLAALTAAARAFPTSRAIFAGGKSMGGRMATHLAAAPERWSGSPRLAGVVAFGYPLRPPGPRGGDRITHLQRLAVPTLIVQGTRDTFGGPDDVRAAVGAAPGLEILPVATGDHSLTVLKSTAMSQAEVDAGVIGHVAEWMHRSAAR